MRDHADIGRSERHQAKVGENGWAKTGTWLAETTEEMSQNAKTEKMTSASSADKSNAGGSIAFLRMYIYPLESLPELEKGPRAKESRVGGLAERWRHQ
jgi:hypothetical protein